MPKVTPQTSLSRDGYRSFEADPNLFELTAQRPEQEGRGGQQQEGELHGFVISRWCTCWKSWHQRRHSAALHCLP